MGLDADFEFTGQDWQEMWTDPNRADSQPVGGGLSQHQAGRLRASQQVLSPPQHLGLREARGALCTAQVSSFLPPFPRIFCARGVGGGGSGSGQAPQSLDEREHVGMAMSNGSYTLRRRFVIMLETLEERVGIISEF